MKKTYIILGLFMLAVLASCGTKVTQPTAVETSTPTQIAETGEVMAGPVVLGSGFVEYDESSIGETDDTVLFFHAAWCGTCKTTEANLIESGVDQDMTIMKVDFDSATELRKKYGVTTKHTFVQIDNEGNMIKKWQGSMDINDIRSEIGDAMMKKDESAMMKKEEVMVKEETQAPAQAMEAKEPSAPVALAGTYADYDESLVGKTDDTVIGFFAKWCPSCVNADKNISASEIPDGLTVLKADFDNEIELRKKYGVVGQHTFVQVDSEGNLVKKWLGGNSVDSIVKQIN